jgi:hypothetical protein
VNVRDIYRADTAAEGVGICRAASAQEEGRADGDARGDRARHRDKVVKLIKNAEGDALRRHLDGPVGDAELKVRNLHLGRSQPDAPEKDGELFGHR